MNQQQGQDWWLAFVEKYLTGVDDRVVFTVGLWLVNFVAFYGFNAILQFMYARNMFPQYRINHGKMPSNELVKDCIWHNLKNNMIIQPLAVYFLFYPLFVSNGMKIRAELPSWSTIARDIVVSLVINDTLFYWAHRGFHHPSIYKYVHKQHHLFNYSIGMASTYAHPLEDILASVVPTLAGCYLMGTHFVVLCGWLFFRLIETIDAHSGYSFPWHPMRHIPLLYNVERHDFHHSHNTGCFGVFGVWDWLCGTDKTFNDFKAKEALELAKKKS